MFGALGAWFAASTVMVSGEVELDRPPGSKLVQ